MGRNRGREHAAVGMTTLTAAEQRHLDAIGPAAVDWFAERFAIMTEGATGENEKRAARAAYERTCKAYSVEPVSAQRGLPGVSA